MTETAVEKSTEIISESSPTSTDAKKKFRAVRQGAVEPIPKTLLWFDSALQWSSTSLTPICLMTSALKVLDWRGPSSNNSLRFMWTLHSQNPEHWVPIKTIASFKRMREFKSEDSEWLLDALKQSTLLEVDESQTNVRRTTEVQEPKNQMERSVYAVCAVMMVATLWHWLVILNQKGFGEEEPMLQERLEEFFNQYGKTNVVRMRREDNKKFKVHSLFA